MYRDIEMLPHEKIILVTGPTDGIGSSTCESSKPSVNVS